MAIQQKVIDITIQVRLEINTDEVSYGIHGGTENENEIVHEALNFYVENAEIIFMSEEGIKQVIQIVQNWNEVN